MLNAFDWFGLLASLFVPLIVIGLFRIDRSRRQAGLGRGASRTAALVAAFASSQLRSRLARVVRALKRKAFRTVAAVNYVKMTSSSNNTNMCVRFFFNSFMPAHRNILKISIEAIYTLRF